MGLNPWHQPDKQNEDSKSVSSSTSFQSKSLQSLPSLTRHQCSTAQHQCISTLRGHTSYISSLTLAGNVLYSGSSDNEIRTWNRDLVDSNHVEDISAANNVVAVGKGAVKSIIVLSDKLFSAHQDNKIRVWKIPTNNQAKYTQVATLPTLGDRAMKLLVPSSHVQVRRHKTSTWVHHVDAVSVLALSEDETLLYSASWDRTIKVWQVSGFRCLESVKDAHDDAINTLALSRDGRVFTGSADKKIKVWRKASGEKKHSLLSTLEEHSSGINTLALSTDESVLYSGASDKLIVVWEEHEGGKMVALGTLRGHSSAILCLAVVEDLVCSGSADKTIRVWRRGSEGYSCLAMLQGHSGPIKCLTAAIDHHKPSYNSATLPNSCPCFLYSGSLDCEIKAWLINVPNC